MESASLARWGMGSQQTYRQAVAWWMRPEDRGLRSRGESLSFSMNRPKAGQNALHAERCPLSTGQGIKACQTISLIAHDPLHAIDTAGLRSHELADRKAAFDYGPTTRDMR